MIYIITVLEQKSITPTRLQSVVFLLDQQVFFNYQKQHFLKAVAQKVMVSM